MDESKEYCDKCKDHSESTYSSNLDLFICEDCWDEYGELCLYGLA